jgi:hypothetical protein
MRQMFGPGSLILDTGIPEKILPAIRLIPINLVWILPLIAIERATDGHLKTAIVLFVSLFIDIPIAVYWDRLIGRSESNLTTPSPLMVGLFAGLIAISITAAWYYWPDEYDFRPDPNIMYVPDFGPLAEIIATKPLDEILKSPYDTRNYVVRGWPGSFMIVRSALLKSLEIHYQLVGMILHHAGSMDIKDEALGGESGRYDIPDTDLNMRIVWSTTYPPQVIIGMKPTFYALVAIPKNVLKKSFSSIRDAINNGGILIQVQSGHP